MGSAHAITMEKTSIAPAVTIGRMMNVIAGFISRQSKTEK